MITRDWMFQSVFQPEGRPFCDDGKFDPDAFDPGAPYSPKGRTFRLCSNPTELWEKIDLLNLRLMRSGQVEALLATLEAMAAQNGRKIVAVLATGGTIASVADASGLLEPVLSVDELLAAIGLQLSQDIAVAGIPHRVLIDSSQQEIDYLADLAISMSWIWKSASDRLKRVLLGFMVTHGTDTIDAAAPYVAMMLGPECPFSVGFVGTQRTRDDRYSDVSVNLRFTIDALAHLYEADVATTFVYGGGTAGGAYRSTGVLKVSDDLLEFLDCPGHDRLITVNRASQRGVVAPFESAYRKRSGFFQPLIMRGYRKVMYIGSDLGFDPDSAYRIVKATEEPAVVLGSYGAFTANTKLVRAVLAAVRETGKVLFVINKLPAGNVAHQYHASQQLRQGEAHPVNMLPAPLAAKITLGLKLFGPDDESLIRFVVERNYVGEQIGWNYADPTSLGPPPEAYESFK